jgi:hypothetical protein
LIVRTITRRITRTASFAVRAVGRVAGRVSGTMSATRAGAQGTTSALQTLPDSTLRALAATSVGVGTGLYLARKPRLVIAAGVIPAVLMGAAIVLRPTEPVTPEP